MTNDQINVFLSSYTSYKVDYVQRKHNMNSFVVPESVRGANSANGDELPFLFAAHEKLTEAAYGPCNGIS